MFAPNRIVPGLLAGLLAATSLLGCRETKKEEEEYPPELDSLPKAATAVPRARPERGTPDLHRITAEGIGPVRLDMTLGGARVAMATARFDRIADEGDAKVSVRSGPERIMVLDAAEDDTAEPIDWARTLVGLETFDSLCRTDAGIHPGSTLAQAQRAYGRIEGILVDDTDAKAFLRFEHPPDGLRLRIARPRLPDPASRTSSGLDPDARILSILVGR
jgi:hypothetical protein